MHGDLSALRKPEMQIFCWFNFLNFLLVQFCPSPILGSISTFKTFMCVHLCVVTFLPHESLMCSFTLPDMSVITQSWKIWHFCITPRNTFSKKFTWNRDWTCNPMSVTPHVFINSHALTTELTWQVLIERYLTSIQKCQICQLCVITEKTRLEV